MIVTAVDRAVGRKLARIEPVMEGKGREGNLQVVGGHSSAKYYMKARANEDWERSLYLNVKRLLLIILGSTFA